MAKLIRFLVIYIGLITTITLVNAIFFTKSITDQLTKSNQQASELIQKNLETWSVQQDKKLSEEIEKIQSQLKTENQVLGTNESSPAAKTVTGIITINDKKWQNVPIYESKSYSAKVIGKAIFEKAYRFVKKDGDWYQITILPGDTTGWVSGRFFTEINDTIP